MKIIKKVLLGLLLTCCYQLNAQEKNSTKQQFDHWSLDLGGGMHQIGSPLSDGYTPNILFQGSLGVRYMFNEKFGLRLDLGYNSFSEVDDTSLPFKSNLYRATIEGVVNLGNVLNFQTWTKRLNLLVHAGAGFSSLNVVEPIDNGGQLITHLSIGITPQFKISNRFSLFLDMSEFFNYGQTDNFDGGKNTDWRETNIAYFNTSIGLNISLGKNKQSADFWQGKEAEVNNELEDIKKRLNTAENVIAGLMVENTNITSDTNKEKLITELDTRYIKKDEGNRYANTVTSSNVEFIKELLNRGYVNVFFDVNKTSIQKASLNSVNYLKQFMFDNPYVSASLIGFADETGKEAYNQRLSNKRAKTVYDILVDAGISPTRLSYGGVGEDKTLTGNAKQLARKVSFRIN